MADIGDALAAHRPRCRVHVDPAVGHLGRPLHLGAVSVRRVDRDSVGGRIHHQKRVTISDDVGAVIGRGLGFTHGDGHGLDDLTIAPHSHRFGGVIGGGDDLVTDGEPGSDVILTEQPVTEVDAVGVDRHLYFCSRFPVFGWAPTYFAIIEPVEGSLDRGVGGHVDRLLRRNPVGDVFIEADRDGLAHANRFPVVGQDVGHR